MPWSSSARGDPHKSFEKFKKRKANQTQTFPFIVEETFISEGFYLRRKLLKPGLAAVPEGTQVPALLLPQEGTGSKDRFFFFLHWVHKGWFFDHKRMVFTPLPVAKWQKLLGMLWCSGFLLNPISFSIRYWWRNQRAQRPKEQKMNQQPRKVSWRRMGIHSHSAWGQGAIAHELAACGADQCSWNRHADRLEIPSGFSVFILNSSECN